MLSKLEDCLIIDTEKGSKMVEAYVADVTNRTELINLVKEATVSGLYGMLGKLAKEDSNTRTKIFQYLKESPSKRNVLFRSAALRGMGYTGTEITQLRRESIETGNSRLADIRNASDEDKIGLKQDAIEKGILTQDGKVNEYYHMELLSSSAFDRETVGFAASFWKKLIT